MAWRDRLLDLLAPERQMAPVERAAVRDAIHAHNLDRAALLTPLLVVLHVTAIVLFWPRGAGAELRWREGLVALHVGALALLLLTGALVFGVRIAALRHRAGELVTALYVGFGAAVVVNSLKLAPTLSAYLIAVAITVVSFRLRLAPALAIHGVALVVVATALAWSPLPPLAQQRHAINAGAIVAFGFLLSRSLYRHAVREVRARRALGELNASLEQRVAAQVTELGAHAREVERLNRDLRLRIRDRSNELTLALERIAAAELGERLLAPGDLLADRYQVERPLGVGAMGVVYAAHDRERQVDVAIKLIRAADSVEVLRRFLVEAKAVATIEHPAVVRILDVDVSSDGKLYQVLELLDGRTLDNRLQEQARLSPPEVVLIGEQVAAGLAAAHRRDIVHRDIKPANIMLISQAPGLKVLDFGLAKLRRQSSTARTAAGLILGTPEFLPPEQISTPDQISGAADVYALGGTLYLCLSGRLPFPGDDSMTLMQRHLYEVPTDLAELVPDAPLALCRLVMSCLAKRPGQRPTAPDLAIRLGELASELATVTLDALERARHAKSTRRMKVGDP